MTVALVVVIVDAAPSMADGAIRGADWYAAIEHAGPGCACGINGAGNRFIDPICARHERQ